MNIRISGGQFKGFKFNNPKSSDLRPTMESVRLAIFSILDSKFNGITNETVFLDLYSGTGIMGTEALSRGADKAIFIEKNRAYCYKIKENLKKLNLLNRAEILSGSVFANLSKIKNKVTHIFLDPPYIFKDYKKLIYEIENNNILNNNGIIIIEMRNKSIDTFLEHSHYNSYCRQKGDTKILFLNNKMEKYESNLSR